MPPAEEKHAASKETVVGKEPEHAVPVSTSGPVTGEKVQAAMSKIPTPKTDDTVDAPTADEKELREKEKELKDKEKEKELKEKSPVGGAEAEPIAGSGEKPAPAETVESAKQGKEGADQKEPSGASKPEEPEAAKDGPANGPAEEPAKEDERAEEAPAGGKRAAVNGGQADSPAKKAKTAATNGGTKGKREKKAPAPVGKTARRTRSQGLGA